MISDPIQIQLIIPKLLESMLFLWGIILGLKQYKGSAWNTRPLFHRLLIIGMCGWFVYIFLDIFIYVFAAVSMEGIVAPAYFEGYPSQFPSLLVVNVLRDIGMGGSLVICFCYMMAGFSARYGASKTKQIFFRTEIVKILIYITCIIIIRYDIISVTIKDSGVRVGAVWTGVSGFALTLMISMYLLVAFGLLFSLPSGKLHNNSETAKTNIKWFIFGVFFMALGNFYWFFLGQINANSPELLPDIPPILYYYFGHGIWTLSPIFISLSLREPVEFAPIRADYHFIGMSEFRDFFENSVFAIYMTSKDRVVFANECMAETLGFTITEIESWTLEDLFKKIHPDNLELYKNLMYPAKNDNKLLGTHYQIRKKDKKYLWIKQFSTEFNLMNESVVLSLFFDISEQKELEETLTKKQIQYQRIESISHLAGGIAHDYNNILAGILGNIGLLQYKKIAEKTQDKSISEIIADLEESTLRAKDLTRKLLTFSEGGSPIKRSTNIIKLIEKASALSKSRSNCHLNISIKGEIPEIEIDGDQISQVLNEIIINAEEAMPGGGEIDLICDMVEFDSKNPASLDIGKYILISIQDHGIGIPEGIRHKIFDPYFSTKDKSNITGLGLPTSFSIIKRHGGVITFDSEVGEGSRFLLYLPYNLESLRTPNRRPKSDEQNVNFNMISENGEIKGKILIMDDETAVIRVLQKMLIWLGYTSDCSYDGESALIMYKKALEVNNPYCGVILDLTIPGKMGGKAVIKKLFEIDPHIKAIVSSGYSHDPIMAQYRDYHFSSVLLKPYTLEQLKESLLDALF